MSFSPEYLQILEDLMNRFNALQESLPHQLEQISLNLSSIQQDNTTARETLENNVLGLIEQTQQQLSSVQAEVYSFINNNLVFKTAANAPNPDVSTSTPTESNSTPTASTNSRIKVRDPQTFYGKATHCNSFFAQLSICFAVDQVKFKTDREKILFAISHLSGNTFAYMEPYLAEVNLPVENQHDVLRNYTIFQETITNAFGDSNPTVRADTAIRASKQTSAVSIYATDFRRLSMLLKWVLML
ncbi:hypothetical protein INT47_007990 [Mucor saturninus]|uniref:DUF4939 domain-containing protein n=1 Tax=Mucor saturninus TaxID=64648 RepID=A0A8H7QGK4_9FUNG|nr:hypothetical protein INT47_007990 [Mucor saturninus]